MRWLGVAFVAAALATAAQDEIDPSLRAAVERFYAAQEAEDAAAYLALWSASAQRPQPAQLKFIFDSGDDKFSNLRIVRVTREGPRAVVRLTVTRDRTLASRRPEGAPIVLHSELQWSLTLLQEAGEWKLVREGPAGEALADAFVSAGSRGERDALLASEPDLVNPMLVTLVARHADAFAIANQFAAAQRIYEITIELATRLGDTRAEAEAWQNLGNAFYFQRRYPDALAAYSRRLDIERARKDEAGVANATLGIATVLYSQFDYAEAIARYREALAIQERLGDTPGIATTLISTGNVQFIQGDFGGALADYRRSRELFHGLTDTRNEASASEGIGRTLAAQGDLAGALNAYALVLAEGQARADRALQANALKSMGDIQFRLGNLDLARLRLDLARTHFEALRDMPNVGRVWHAIGLTDLVATRFAQAEQDYRSSIAACSTGGEPFQDGDCAARGFVGVGFAQAAQQHYEDAVSSYRRGMASFLARKQPEDAARAEIGLSQALYGSKDYPAALAAATHAAGEAVGLKKDDVLWRALVVQARANRRLGNAERAMEAARDAVAAVRRLMAGFEELPAEPVPADTAGAFAVLATLQAESGDADGAFATVEQRRAHALRIALASTERDIHPGMTEAERDEERRLTVAVVSIAAQIRNEVQLPRPDGVRIARLGERLAAAKAARTEVRQKIFGRLPALALWRGLGASASAAEALAAFAEPPPLIVEFVVSEDDLLAVVIEPAAEGTLKTRAYLSHVESHTVAQRVTHALDPATLRSADAWRDAAAEVVKLVPAAAWTAMGNAPRVLIVPDDVLWHVPFEALPFEGQVLGDKTAIRYVASVTSLLPPAATPAPPSTLLAVASPELTAAEKERMTATAPDWIVRGSDASEAEARAVVRALGAESEGMMSGATATEAAFRTRAPGAGWIHVAAPFRVNGASPLFSPVLLGGDPAAVSSENDGVLEAREMFDLTLHARAVVLTDGAALSMRAAAPAIDVVAWAWRAAGVSSIVVPRWSASRESSAGLLEEFYTQIRGGASIEVALQRARAAIRAREDTHAPVHWAGWMLVGPPERTAKPGG